MSVSRLIDHRPHRDWLTALYAVPSASLAKALHDIGDGLAAQCAELARNPTASGCDELAANLEGARAHLARLQAALLREQGGPNNGAA